MRFKSAGFQEPPTIESMRAKRIVPGNYAWVTKTNGRDISRKIRLLADMTAHGGTSVILEGEHDTVCFRSPSERDGWEMHYPVLPAGLAKNMCDNGNCVLKTPTNIAISL
jgi:hypothetical protein